MLSNSANSGCARSPHDVPRKSIEPSSRHQCLIDEGVPSLHLPSVARVARTKLGENYRFLYMNNPLMVAGMQSYLAAEGADVGKEIARGSLVVTSERQHLLNGVFSVDRMLQMLEQELLRALADGYVGLWAAGDMTWQMGGEKNLTRLLEYERRLENFFRAHPEMGGICQYCTDTLPREAVSQALVAHRSILINETLSIVNVHYLPPGAPPAKRTLSPEM